MNIAYIIADRHIPVFGEKGASVHVQETIASLTALGHKVTVYAARCGEQNHDSRFKENQAIVVADRIRDAVVRDADSHGFDFIYERYSLFSKAGVEAAESLAIPALIEVNSPLVQEQLAFRKLVNLQDARAIEAHVFTHASSLLAVSDEVREYIFSISQLNQQRRA